MKLDTLMEWTVKVARERFEANRKKDAINVRHPLFVASLFFFSSGNWKWIEKIFSELLLYFLSLIFDGNEFPTSHSRIININYFFYYPLHSPPFSLIFFSLIGGPRKPSSKPEVTFILLFKVVGWCWSCFITLSSFILAMTRQNSQQLPVITLFSFGVHSFPCFHVSYASSFSCLFSFW